MTHLLAVMAGVVLGALGLTAALIAAAATTDIDDISLDTPPDPEE